MAFEYTSAIGSLLAGGLGVKVALYTCARVPTGGVKAQRPASTG